MPHPIRAIKDWRAREYGMGFGQGGTIKDLRKEFGQAYNDFAKKYNSTATDILQQAREAANAEGYTGRLESYLETDTGKAFNDQLIQTRNQLINDYNVEGLGNQLQNALDDYSSVNGRQFISKRHNDVMGILKNGDYKSTLSRSTTTEGFEATIDGKNYEYIRTDQRDVARGELGAELNTPKTESFYKRRAYTLDTDGKKVYGSFSNVTKDDWRQVRHGLDPNITVGADLEFDAKGKVVPTGSGGVTSVTQEKGYVGKTKGDFGIPDPSSSSVRRAYKNIYNNSIQDEAAKIAKTGVGENSGIFKSITSAAKANPVVAAAVAIGGFGIINKMLDRRREYD